MIARVTRWAWAGVAVALAATGPARAAERTVQPGGGNLRHAVAAARGTVPRGVAGATVAPDLSRSRI